MATQLSEVATLSATCYSPPVLHGATTSYLQLPATQPSCATWGYHQLHILPRILLPHILPGVGVDITSSRQSVHRPSLLNPRRGHRRERGILRAVHQPSTALQHILLPPSVYATARYRGNSSEQKKREVGAVFRFQSSSEEQ